MQQKLLHQATPGIGSTAEPLMTRYQEGDTLGPGELWGGQCPHCQAEGTLEQESGDSTTYTYICSDCGWEMDVEIIHRVTEVRKP